MADNYPQSPNIMIAMQSAQNQGAVADTPAVAIGQFPNDREKERLDDYEYYGRLFLGKHFEAFRIKIDDEKYNRAYARLRYLVVNFAGLLSKIVADMLFSEPPTVKMPKGDQDWVDALWHKNNLDVQCYESALGNSYNGDALFKLRVGKRTKDGENTVIIEDISPKIYFPKVDGFNVRGEPGQVDLKWTFRAGEKLYLRVERHLPGMIENHVYEMEGNKIMTEVGLDILGIDDLLPEVETGIDELMVVHVPNWKTGDRHFGLSDYNDIDTLFFALNNRLSKIDNILDKHGDPILMVPPGVLDEKGNVNKKALGVIEVEPGDASGGKPEYIVWDASLDSAFKEIEKLVDFLYLTAEISPDLLGMGEGVSESGRALKFKLMRTIAKVARKRLYYDHAIKEVIYRAQLLAVKHGLTVDGLALKGKPEMPEIDWQDGLPTDSTELQADLIAAIDAGIESKKDAIMKLEGVDEDSAKKKLEEIEESKPKITLPVMGLGKDNINNKSVANPKAPTPFIDKVK